MKKVKIASAVLMAILISCSQQKQEWQGTIEEIDGVTMVKNPKQGLWDTKENSEITIKQKLQIGELDGPEEFLFVYISDAAVNSKGDIYIADRELKEVRKFNKEGEYLLKIGRPGQGPGEFQSISTLSITPQDELIVFDNMQARISIFSDRGEHIKTTTKLIKNSWILPSKMFSENGNTILFGKLGDSLKLFHEFDNNWNLIESYIDYDFIDNREFEEQSLIFDPGNCVFQQNGDIFYAKPFYDNQIYIYKNKELKKIISRESDINKPYEVKVYHDVDKAMNIKDQDYDFKSFGRGIAFIGKTYQSSLGLYQLSNGYLVNFLSIRRSKSLYEIGVELYDQEGKFLTYSKIGENLGYDIRCLDSQQLFYAINRKDYNKVLVFRLEYDGIR